MQNVNTIRIELSDEEARGLACVLRFASRRLDGRKTLPTGWNLLDMQQAGIALATVRRQLAEQVADDGRRRPE